MPEWTVPAFPWNHRTFQNKSVALLRFCCNQKGIDISNQNVYKNTKTAYRQALLKWYRDAYLAEEAQQQNDDSASLHNLSSSSSIHVTSLH